MSSIAEILPKSFRIKINKITAKDVENDAAKIVVNPLSARCYSIISRDDVTSNQKSRQNMFNSYDD